MLIVLAISIFPRKIGLVDIGSALHSTRNVFEEHALLIFLLILISALNSNVRGTMRYVAYETKIIAYKLNISIGILLLLAAAFISDKGIINDYPASYGYAGCLFLILGLLSGFLQRQKQLSIGEQTSIYREDRTVHLRSNLDSHQTIVLDNLVGVLSGSHVVRSVGLYGPWGVGKSSIIETAKSEILNKSRNIIWVNFEPWRYTSQESLTLGFYGVIGKGLEENIKGIQNTVAELLKLAAPLVNKLDSTGAIKTFSNLAIKSLSKQSDSPEEYITNVLEREGKELIVIIDDVERMYSKVHIQRTIQLAHFLKNSGRVKYVFIADKLKLMQAVPDHHSDSRALYLEKFIEYELYVPTPKVPDLVRFLDKLLSSKTKLLHIDFTLEGLNPILRDASTYRGVLKTFNQFMSGLQNRFVKNNQYLIKLEDKFVLDHFAIKYPSVWLDIEANRDVYAGKLHDFDFAITRGFDSEDKNIVKDHIETFMTSLTLSKESMQFVLETLKTLFPEVDNAYSNNGSTNIDYSILMDNMSIAHPDILDLYFANSVPYEEYQQVNSEISGLLDQANKIPFRHLIDKYAEYLKRHQEDIEVDFLILLRRSLEKRFTSIKSGQRHAKALLIAYCMTDESKAEHNENRKLGVIVGYIDYYGKTLYENQEELDKYFRYVFGNIERYRPHPSTLLTLGLFTLKERNNHFVSFDNWNSYEWLRTKILVYTDQFYLKGDKASTLRDLATKNWTFIYYQWAMGIITTRTTEVPEKNYSRWKTANDFIFTLLLDDHKLAYGLMKRMFFYSRFQDDEPEWHVSKQDTVHFDRERLISLVAQLNDSKYLNKSQRMDMAKLLHTLRIGYRQ